MNAWSRTIYEPKKLQENALIRPVCVDYSVFLNNSSNPTRFPQIFPFIFLSNLPPVRPAEWYQIEFNAVKLRIIVSYPPRGMNRAPPPPRLKMIVRFQRIHLKLNYSAWAGKRRNTSQRARKPRKRWEPERGRLNDSPLRWRHLSLSFHLLTPYPSHPLQ
jgi:hypothetical protein